MDKRSPGARVASAWLIALLLTGCDDSDDTTGSPVGATPDPVPDPVPDPTPDPVPDDGLDGTAREARAAELFAPRETLPLTGTRWQVEALVLPDAGKLPLLSGIEYTLELDAGGKSARGVDGCAAYRRGYELDGKLLRLAPPEDFGGVGGAGDAGDPACAASELETVERSIVGGLLGSTARFEIRGDRLFLESPDGAALVLRGRPLGEIPAGVGPGLPPEFAEDGRVPFAVLEDSDGRNLGERAVSVPDRFVTAHDPTGFATLWRNAHSFDPGAPVPEVRFDVGSVVAVFSPLRPSSGYDVSVDAIVAGAGGPEGGPRVLVTTTVPGEGCVADETATVPYEIVAVPTLMPSPRFEEIVTEGEPCA